MSKIELEENELDSKNQYLNYVKEKGLTELVCQKTNPNPNSKNILFISSKEVAINKNQTRPETTDELKSRIIGIIEKWYIDSQRLPNKIVIEEYDRVYQDLKEETIFGIPFERFNFKGVKNGVRA